MKPQFSLRVLMYFGLLLGSLGCDSNPSEQPALKRNEYTWHKSQGQHELIYTLFAENGFWNVNLYRVTPGELQELQWHSAFSTEEKARAYLTKFLTANELISPNPELVKNNYPVTEDPNSVIWKTENQWNWDWEVKYSDWLAKNYTRDIYIQNNIAVDCADNATAIRWIFSRIHKLPAGNHFAGTGIVFTNESMKEEWKNLPTDDDWRKDQRFLKALDYVLDNTYTHTVFKDGYPIAISKEAFLAGTYMIDLQGESGHTRVVSYVSYEKNGQVPIRVLQSGAPKRLQALGESPFWEQQPVKDDNEMLKPRWPVKVNGQWDLVPSEQMPHYSLEQFDPKFPGETKDFTLAIYKRLMPDFDPLKLVSEGLEELLKRFPERNRIVNEGYEFCKKNSCPEGTKEWEDWSTPMRDKGLLDYFDNLEKLAQLIGEINPEARRIWEEGIHLKFIPVMTYQKPTIKQLLFIWRYGLFDSNPNVPPDQRWAVDYQKTAQAMTYKIKSLLNERVDRVAKNLETHQIDTEIQRFYVGMIQYCETFQNSCAGLRQILREQTWTLGGFTQNLPTWLERSLWFNADPRAALEMRWGKLHEIAVPIHGLVDARTSISKNEILLGGDIENLQLHDLQNRNNVNIPSGWKVEDLEVKKGLGLLIHQNQPEIAAFEPRSQKLVSLKLSAHVVKARWLSPSVVVAKLTTSGMLVVAKFSDGKFSNVTEVESINSEIDRVVSDQQQFPLYYESHDLTRPRDIFYISHDEYRFTIYDFTDDVVKKTAIRYRFPNEIPSEYMGFVTHVSPTHYLIRVIKVSERCPANNPFCVEGRGRIVSYAVNKATGRIVKYNYFLGKQLAPGKYIGIIASEKNENDRDVFVGTFDEAFALKERTQKIGVAFRWDESNYVHLWTKGNNGQVLRINLDGSLKSVVETSPRMMPHFHHNDRALMQLTTGMGIYDLIEKKMKITLPWIEKADGYMTGKSAFYFGGDAAHVGLFRFEDDAGVPLVTGLSTFLALRQTCSLRLNLRMGAYTEFNRESYRDSDPTSQCNGDRNLADGVIFYIANGRAFYLPASAKFSAQ